MTFVQILISRTRIASACRCRLIEGFPARWSNNRRWLLEQSLWTSATPTTTFHNYPRGGCRLVRCILLWEWLPIIVIILAMIIILIIICKAHHNRRLCRGQIRRTGSLAVRRMCIKVMDHSPHWPLLPHIEKMPHRRSTSIVPFSLQTYPPYIGYLWSDKRV